MWIATEPRRYGQQSARGMAVTRTSGIPTAMPPTPISAKASVWSLMPCAIAFQTACVMAAAMTAKVTVRERVVDGSNGLLRQAEQEPSGLLSRQVFPRLLTRASWVAAPLGPAPAILIVSVT